MKAKLNLTSPMWFPKKRQEELNRVVQQAAIELEGEIKLTISESIPAGRTYRLGRMTAALTGKNKGLGLREFTTPAGKTRVITGYRIHRASRRGQPPAILHGRLINSIRGRAIGFMRARVATSVKYAPILDDPLRLDRPFFISTVQRFKPKYLARIRAAMKG